MKTKNNSSGAWPPFPVHARPYLDVLLAGDEQAASDFIDRALESGEPLERLYLGVIAPVQQRMGEMWVQGELSIALEHRATEITSRQLERMRNLSSRKSPIGRKAAVACVDGEQHTIGARMVNDLLFLDGWEVYFLGSSMPGNEIADFAVQERLDLVALSLVISEHVSAAEAAIVAIRRRAPGVKVLIGGPNISEFTNLTSAADAYALSAQEVTRVAREVTHIPPLTPLTEVLHRIGERIQSARKSRGLSQLSVAASAGLDRAYISGVERGKQNVSISVLLRIAQALDLSISELTQQ
jgi:methanogenic corrinoid protein MtbC1/DNA-binding XRE family transcriptional regulator